MNMTTKLLLWLILAILLGWLWFGPWSCCWQQWLCPDCVKGAVQEEQIGSQTGREEPVALAHLPIEFLKGSAEPHTYEGWEALKDSLVSGLTDGKQLLVTGYYFEGEEAPEGFETMGLARANKVIDLLANSIPREQMTARSLLVEAAQIEHGKVLNAVDFGWEDRPTETEKTEQASLEQISTERVLLHFPTNSAKASDVGPDIEAYLDKAAERVKKSGEQILLIGHTDNRGSDKLNTRLGRKRAEFVRDLLLRRGVPAKQISVKSMGAKDPVASNKTKEGRAQNRRVELKIQASGKE